LFCSLEPFWLSWRQPAQLRLPSTTGHFQVEGMRARARSPPDQPTAPVLTSPRLRELSTAIRSVCLAGSRAARQPPLTGSSPTTTYYIHYRTRCLITAACCSALRVKREISSRGGVSPPRITRTIDTHPMGGTTSKMIVSTSP